MPDTRVTKEKLKTHLHYGKWVYILIAAVAFFVVELTYTMTEYRPDKYHRVDIQLVGNATMQDEALEALGKSAAVAVSAQDPKLEAVNFYNISYSGDASTDIYGAQKYAVMLAAGEGGIYFINRPLLESMVAQGGALPLEAYVESGVLPGELAVSLPETDEEGNPTGNTHLYALDASGLGGMLSDDIGYDIRDKYAVIFASCVNPDTAAAVLRNVFDQLSGSAPDSEFARNAAAADAQATAEAQTAPGTQADATAAPDTQITPEAQASPGAQTAAPTPSQAP
jgi:hypothetical protein